MSESGSRSCKKKPYKDKGRERYRVRGTWNASEVKERGHEGRWGVGERTEKKG